MSNDNEKEPAKRKRGRPRKLDISSIADNKSAKDNKKGKETEDNPRNRRNYYKNKYNQMANNSNAMMRDLMRASMSWYYNKVRIATDGYNIQNYDAYSTIFDMSDGGVFQYVYHAKHEKTLPYWDAFPMIIPIKFYANGWLGLNLHYMPPAIRAAVFDDIVAKGGQKDRLQLSYEWVMAYSKHKIIQHGVKRYLSSHVVSPIIQINESEWDKAIMLPSQTFMKKTDKEVWSDFR